MKSLLLIISYVFLLFCLKTNAQITNGGFENSMVSPEDYNANGYYELEAGSLALDPWMIGAEGIDYIDNVWASSEGSYSIDLNQLSAGTISQSFNTTIGNWYTVSFDLAGNANCGPNEKIVEVSVDNISEQFSFDVLGFNNNNMGWEGQYFMFQATTTNSTVLFKSLTSGSCGPAIDNVVSCQSLIEESFSFVCNSNILINGGFENSSASPEDYNALGFFELEAGSLALDPWILGEGGIDYLDFYWEHSEGLFSIDLNRHSEGTISQSFNTTIGNWYSVSFDLAGNANCGPNEIIVEVSVANYSEQFSFSVAGLNNSNMGWEGQSFMFRATTMNSTILFKSLTSSSCGPALDNVMICQTNLSAICDCGDTDVLLEAQNLHLYYDSTPSTFAIRGELVDYNIYLLDYNENVIEDFSDELTLVCIDNSQLSNGQYFISIVHKSNNELCLQHLLN